MAQEFPPLTALDHDQMRRLVAQEAYTPAGERARQVLIERMIMERITVQKSSDPHILHIPTSRDRYNLIVTRGNPDAPYHVLVPAHIDSVEPTAEPEKMLELKTDDSAHRWSGLSVYDMGEAALNNIALAAEVDPPEGMCVHFAFTVDEEDHSDGAQSLTDTWEFWHKVQLVLSSEIGPLPEHAATYQNDPSMRLIIGRKGRLKIRGSINIPRSAQGHGALRNLPNASNAFVTLETTLWKRFHRPRTYEGREYPPLMCSHPILGDERYSLGPIQTNQPQGYMGTSKAEWDAYVDLVPPSTAREKLCSMQEAAQHLTGRKHWTRYQINHALVMHPEETSYDPFCMPENHPAVRLACDALNRFSGTSTIVCGGDSVADENLYAAALRKNGSEWYREGRPVGVLSIPIIGDCAHHPDEWVCFRDVARVREVLRQLLTAPHGFVALSC